MRRASCLLTILLALPQLTMARTPTPEAFFGHPVGADRALADYPKILDYLRLVASESPRVSIEELGDSTLGNDMLLVILTSERNQRRLDRLREIAGRLANPDRLTGDQERALVDEGVVIALVTCSIHSTEVGCTQMATEFVHEFATTDDTEKETWMDDVVLLLMPSLNPDGQILVVDWYREYLDTEWEGGRMPWLYHHYVGHDNNRDFYMLTQKETRIVNDVLYHRWFPQVFLDQHQMGSTGPRMFVPPQTDPLAPEVHSLIFRQADLLGTNMSYRLEEAGKLGVGHNMIFDSYWPGGTRNTAWWKNVTGLLSEVASVRIATPIHIAPGELRGSRKGLPEYTRRANFPSPWPGGWWRLRDIIDYERIATWAFTETLSNYREEFLANFARMGREAVATGGSESPRAWLVAPDQHDPVAAGRLVELLLEHGIRVLAAETTLSVGRTEYPAGTHLIPAAQPYRAFLLTMLRSQRYPEVRPYRDGPILPPYDVTSWSLPISMGVDIVEIDEPIDGRLRAIDRPVWQAHEPVGESTGGYLMSHSADSAPIAVNRLLARESPVFFLEESSGSGEAGDIYLPSGTIDRGGLAAFVEELHLEVLALDEPPTGPLLRVGAQEVGLYKPWIASMDEGWTRWLLERYEFPYRNLSNDDIKDGSFRKHVQVLLFPDIEPSYITSGEPDSPERRRFFNRLPPKYAGGIEPDGGEQIREWVEEGGTVVALDSSTDYLIDLFQLPVVNVLGGRSREEVEAPGTMLRILVDTDHPLGFGLRPREAAYFAASPAFRTRVPDARFERSIVARYPDHRDDIPISGFIRGAENLERLAAVVEFRVGAGRVVLIGFRAQHRAQPLRTFKLLFNAIYLGGLEPAAL
jgi:hypothetical protein